MRTELIEQDFADFDISRDRDQFLRELLRELAGTLEDVVGIEDASGFISTVGARLGHVMNDEYRAHAGVAKLNKNQIAAALVDLKMRIKGGFKVTSITDDEIVLENTACPFGDYVKGRKSLCMMTSNVFGRIAADNTGYAEVALPETIAQGDARCRVIVSFKPNALGADHGNTREYFSSQ